MAQSLLTRQALHIGRESPDQPEVRALLAELDAYLGSLYEPQHNHILGLDELQSPKIFFVVARCQGRAVGCGAMWTMPGEPATAGQPYGEVKRMMVEPAARGAGVGAQLLQRLEQQLVSEQVGLALLETGSLQQQAVALYERAGYVRRPAFGGYPDNGLSLFMQKRLLP